MASVSTERYSALEVSLPSLCQVFPAEAERRRTNSDPVRVHLLRIAAPDRTRPKPRDDGSKRLPIWAVTRSPRLTRRFESQLLAGVTSRGSATRLNVPKRAIYAAAFMGNAFVSRIQRIPGRDCYLTATAECKLQ